MPNKHIKIEPITTEEEYKTYTTKSVLRLVPSRNYNNQKFICKVSHPTLPDGHKKYSLNISVQCKCQDPAVNWDETINFHETRFIQIHQQSLKSHLISKVAF